MLYAIYGSNRKFGKKTQTVCFGSLAQRNSISRETIYKFLKAVPENSLKIFDINLRLHYYTKDIIHDSLSCFRGEDYKQSK